MKVALVCPDDLSTVLYCKGLTKALIADPAMEVILLSSPMADYQYEVQNLGGHYIPTPMQRFLSPLKDLSYLLQLFHIFKKTRPDVVVAWTTKCNIFSALAAWLTGVRRVIFSVRGLGSAFQEDNTLKARTLNGVVLGLYRLACRAAERVWFINQDNLNFFLSKRLITADQAFLTTNGIDMELYSPTVVPPERLQELRRELGLTPQHRVVVMVGRLIWPKGVREFAEAAERLWERLPEVRLLLLGPWERESPNAITADYLQEIQRLPNFAWLGFRKDVKDFYALAELAVLPSYYKEGIPRALLEPMAMGKPVIATDTKECRIVVEQGYNGYLIPPQDSQALAEAIEILMINESKRQEFGAYSLAKVEREFNEKSVIVRVKDEILVNRV